MMAQSSDRPPGSTPSKPAWTQWRRVVQRARRVGSSFRSLPFFLGCPPIQHLFDYITSVKTGRIKILPGLPLGNWLTVFGGISKMNATFDNPITHNDVKGKLSPSTVYDEIPVFDRRGIAMGTSYVPLDHDLRKYGTVREFVMDSVSSEKRPYHPLAAKWLPSSSPIIRVRVPTAFEYHTRRMVSQHETDQREYIERRLVQTLERAIPTPSEMDIEKFGRWLPRPVQPTFQTIFSRDGDTLLMTKNLAVKLVHQIRHLIHDVSFLPIINQVASGLCEAIGIVNERGGLAGRLAAFLYQKPYAKQVIAEFHPVVMAKMKNRGLDLMADYYSVQVSYHIELKMRVMFANVLDRIWSHSDDARRRVFEALQPIRPVFKSDLWTNMYLEEATREHGADSALPALAFANRRLRSKLSQWTPIPINLTALVAPNGADQSDQHIISALESLLSPAINISIEVLICLFLASVQSAGLLINQSIRLLFKIPKMRDSILGLVESLLFYYYRDYVESESDLPPRLYSKPEDDVQHPPPPPRFGLFHSNPAQPWVDIE
jgi:hypothetical protein